MKGVIQHPQGNIPFSLPKFWNYEDVYLIDPIGSGACIC